MPNLTTMTCHRCGETFPIGQAHTEVHCNQHLADKTLEVEMNRRAEERKATPEPPYPPLETV